MNSDLKIASLEPTRPDHLKIRRLRRGSGFAYVRTNGRQIHESTTIRRLERLAVPPAYRDTRFAISLRAHIQAVGRDAAACNTAITRNGRIRELRKARRLAKLIEIMPMIRRSITKILKQTKMDRTFAAAVLVDLIACTAIRSGSEASVRERGTRGAATLLKNHV
jgi:DNA topoisomerase-1